MFKLIASDLDGTLLRSDKTISKETIDALIKCNEKGIIFAPSTGRTHLELPDPIKNLPFLHYGLCVNGGEIYDYKEDKCIYEVNISNEKAIEVLEFIKQLPIYPSLVIHGKRYMQGDENGDIIPYIKCVGVKSILDISIGVPDFISFLQENKEGVQKFLLYPQNVEDNVSLMETLKEQFPDLSICMSGPLYIEVNANGVDKGKGLKILCNHLHIDLQETVAFGDASNDIALLDAAGWAVVMANGSDETKEHANEIADTCDNDGLRKILEKYCL